MTKDLVGQTFTNSRGQEFIVESLDPVRIKKHRIYNVIFLKTGYKTKSKRDEILNGLLRDKLLPDICGIASLGYATVKGNQKTYLRWHNMISRCYNPETSGYHNYGGAGVRVCDRWLRFDYFMEDLVNIDGYDKESFEAGILHLDKDLKQLHLPKSERIYSLETCVLMTKKENDKYRENNHHLRHSFKATSPSGEIIDALGIKSFSKEHGLNATMVSRCLRGIQSSYKGWTFVLNPTTVFKELGG